jgi:CheY-like chemotaxis protein
VATATRGASSVEGGIDVLVVEDQPESALLLETLLTTHGCIVRVVSTAQAALGAAGERRPDVVVTELDLAGGHSGCTLAWALRSQVSTMHVGVVAVSADPDAHGRAAPPVDAYFAKPIGDLDALVRVVGELAAKSRAGLV